MALFTGAGLLAALLVASPAAADRFGERDPAHDTTVFDPTTGTEAPAPRHAKLDIRRVVVRHTDVALIVRVIFRRFTRPVGDEHFQISGHAKVDRQAWPSESDHWHWWVDFDKDHAVRSPVAVLDGEHEQQFGCYPADERLRARALYGHDWVKVVIPRHCLAYLPNIRPRWVKASVGVQHFLGGDQPIYSDNLGAFSHFTPRLYAG
jgi:hypothetical protein